MSPIPRYLNLTNNDHNDSDNGTHIGQIDHLQIGHLQIGYLLVDHLQTDHVLTCNLDPARAVDEMFVHRAVLAYKAFPSNGVRKRRGRVVQTTPGKKVFHYETVQ